MKKSLLIILLVISCSSLFAQVGEKKISSSKKAVNTQFIIDEAESLIKKDPSLALDKLEEALSASIANKDLSSQGRCYLLLAEINENIREWNLANDYYAKAYQIFLPLTDYKNEAIKALKGQGSTYLQLQEYQLALDRFQLLLKSDNTIEGQFYSFLNISEVYFQQGNYETALSYAERAEKILGRRKVRSNNQEILNQKAKIYARMNELDKAQEAFKQGNYTDEDDEDFANAVTVNPSSQEIAQEEITKNLRSQNRYEEEIDFRSQNIQQKISTNNLTKLSKEKVELGELYIETGESMMAINELVEASFIADTSGNFADQSIAYLSLAEAFKNMGDKINAIEYYDKYSIASQKLVHEKDSQLASRSEIIRKQKLIEEQVKDLTIGEQSYQLQETRDSLEQSMITRQRLIIYGLCFILLIIIVTSFFIYKNAQASKLANQLLALKSLRSQMNPHFIFNALNSVNQFISQNDERAANKFLAEFSKLMRLVLDHSHEDFITLSQEKEIISLYLKLEQYRFREKFDYSLSIDENIELDTINIPPMLIQPYIENAVWHGLRYKKEYGHLSINIRNENHHLVATIEDDGIGRKNSQKLKTENQKLHNSRGIKNIEERLKILNKVYKTNYRIQVEDIDKQSHEGTRVTIHIPNNSHG